MTVRTEQRRAAFAKAAELRKALGVAVRRKPGRLPRDEERAYRKVIAGSELSPEEHVDALVGALAAAHPEASVLEICSWLDPGFLKRELGDDYHKGASHIAAAPEKPRKRRASATGARGNSEPRAIIQGSGLEALAGVPDPARTEGGSDR